MIDTPKINGIKFSISCHHVDINAPWLVFGNSLITDMSIHKGQVENFKKHYNILRYDQRGHGGTAIDDTPLDFEVLSDDLIAILDHYEISQCHYVGLSMGVPTGLAAYAKDPKRFSSMTFIDGQAQSQPGADQQWQDRIDGAKANGMEAFAKAVAGRWITRGERSERRRVLETMIASTPLKGFSYCAAALKSYDYSDVILSLSCPVLLLAGEKDGKMPEVMKTMARQIKNATFRTIALAGHVPSFEEPEAVNQEISAFFSTFAEAPA